MKIVSRETFLTLPKGTVYYKINDYSSDRLCVKYETLGDDWYYKDFDSISAFSSEEQQDRLEEMEKTGKSYPICKALSRDGLFCFDEEFMIYEKEDVEYIVSEMVQLN